MQSLSVLAILLFGASSDGSSMVAAFSPSSANSKIGRIRTRTGTSTSTSNAIDKKPSSTTLYLEDHIADLIDRELVRVGKLKEWEAEFTAKNKQYLEPLSNPEAAESLLSTELGGGGGNGSSFAPNTINPMQLRRDKKLAEKNPQQYCADRCVATGNCDVYEDIFEMSPTQVMEFCNDCVLAEDEDAECPVDMLYDDEDDTSDLRTSSTLRP